MNLDPAKNPVTSANVGLYGLEQSVEAGMGWTAFSIELRLWSWG